MSEWIEYIKRNKGTRGTPERLIYIETYRKNQKGFTCIRLMGYPKIMSKLKEVINKEIKKAKFVIVNKERRSLRV